MSKYGGRAAGRWLPPLKAVGRGFAEATASPVKRSIALWVLVSLIVVEAAILIPSVIDRRDALVAEIDSRNRYAAQVAVSAPGVTDPAAAIARLPEVARVRSLRVVSGDAAPRRSAALEEGRILSHWRLQSDGRPIAVSVLLRGEGIGREVLLFSLRVVALVFLIAAVVTGTAMVIVGRRVLRPLNRVIAAVRRARRTGQREYIDPVQPGEFGELVAEYNATLREQKAAEERGDLLHHKAMHDPLTGLPNRALFGDRLAQAIGRAQRYGERSAVLLLDLDQFKLFNDSHGHIAGDELLRAVAERLRDTLRTSDTVARIGGDEFAVIQPRVEGADAVGELAERLREAMGHPYELAGLSASLTASVGVTVVPEDGDDSDTLLVNADLAMYRAKQAGGDRVRRFSEEMRDEVRQRLRLADALGRALDAGQLVLYYQPVVDLGRGVVAGFEALVRWQHPEWGLVSPGQFLPVAERTGMIVRLGEWVMARAGADFPRLRALAPECERIAVNVSAAQLEVVDADALLERSLAGTGARPCEVTLEITESAVLECSGATLAGLERASALGALIAIDDFGTGYSSLAQVQDVPGDILKIDRRFVAGLTASTRSRDLFASIVAMGHSLGMKVVAEGIETDEQLRAVRASGCDAAQGFLLARPQPLAVLETDARARLAR